MKNLICLLVMFVASIGYASNCFESEKAPVQPVTESVDSITKVNVVKPLECYISTTSTSTTNPDGSSTRTTTTEICCDTPQELAELHALMVAIGMGV